jgi:RHS repeat-associated protein
MNPKPPHTVPHSTSKAAAYGYGTYTSTPTKVMYVRTSKPDYSYFGARYYDSELSVWLSVDPLSDKYPSMSAFMYTAGNPVMLIDPDGKDIHFLKYTGDDAKKVGFSDLNLNIQKAIVKFAKTKIGYNFLKQFAKAGDSFGSKEAGGIIKFAKDGKNSDHNFNFLQADNGDNPTWHGDANVRQGKGKLEFDVRLNSERENPNAENIAVTIGHEIFIHLDPDNRLDKFINLFMKKDNKGFRDFRANVFYSLDYGKKDHSYYVNKKNNSYNRMHDLATQCPSLKTALIEHDRNYSYLKK